MEFTEKQVGQVLVIEISGDIMGSNEDTEKFKNALYKAIEAEHTNIVVDMAKATWMNSSGLGMLISGLSTVRSSGGDLRLANLSERLKRPFIITKLDSVFQSYDSLEQAVNSFK